MKPDTVISPTLDEADNLADPQWYKDAVIYELHIKAYADGILDEEARAQVELSPHQVAFYLRELAANLHSFYFAEKVLVEDEAIMRARLALVLATRQVLRNGLGLIGVSAPDQM